MDIYNKFLVNFNKVRVNEAGQGQHSCGAHLQLLINQCVYYDVFYYCFLVIGHKKLVENAEIVQHLQR
jgi:hypothetical protein